MGTERYPKSSFTRIQKGEPLRLREGIFRQLRDREWIFNRAEDDIIFLLHKSGAYGVVVKTGDIDWNVRSGAAMMNHPPSKRTWNKKVVEKER